jgi:hypothetical protein
MVPKISPIQLVLFEEVMNEGLWWSAEIPMIGPVFSKLMVATLHRDGLQRISDAWLDGRFMTAPEVQAKFGMQHNEGKAWNKVTEHWLHKHPCLAHGLPLPASEVNEWIGIYTALGDDFPIIVVKDTVGGSFQIGPPGRQWALPTSIEVHNVLQALWCLVKIQQVPVLRRNEAASSGGPMRQHEVFRVVLRMRIVDVVRGPRNRRSASSTVLFKGCSGIRGVFSSRTTPLS